MKARNRLRKRDLLFLLIGVVAGVLAMTLFMHFGRHSQDVLHVTGDTIRYADGSAYYGVVDEALVPNGYGVKVISGDVRYAGVWNDGV